MTTTEHNHEREHCRRRPGQDGRRDHWSRQPLDAATLASGISNDTADLDIGLSNYSPKILSADGATLIRTTSPPTIDSCRSQQGGTIDYTLNG